MNATPGLFSWREELLAFASRKLHQIMNLCQLYFLFYLRQRSGRMPPAERSALYVQYSASKTTMANLSDGVLSPCIDSSAVSDGAEHDDGVNSFAMGFVPSTDSRLSISEDERF